MPWPESPAQSDLIARPSTIDAEPTTTARGF